jgi:hypothetical protein
LNPKIDRHGRKAAGWKTVRRPLRGYVYEPSLVKKVLARLGHEGGAGSTAISGSMAGTASTQACRSCPIIFRRGPSRSRAGYSTSKRSPQPFEVCLIACFTDVAVDGSVDEHLGEAALRSDSVAIDDHRDESRVGLKFRFQIFQNRGLSSPPRSDRGRIARGSPLDSLDKD